jgi:hypothetical protein
MCNVSPMLGGRFLLAALTVLLGSLFDQGLTSARADHKKPAEKAPHAVSNKKPAAKPVLPKPHAHAHKYPRVHAAMHKLQQSWVELEHAAPIFGEHQIAAMQLVAEAYIHLNAGIEGTPGKKHPEMMPLRPLPHGKDFPRIRTALARIHEAQHELKKAAPMHGHREAAIVELNAAIMQLEHGMQYARNHK